MKVKEGFILRKVLDKYLVVPYGIQSKENPRILNLTDSAALLWIAMEKDVSMEELYQILSQAYPDVAEETIIKDTLSFINKLRNENYLANED